MRKRNLGKRGEDLALEYLKGLKYRFIDKNVSCSFGEIDSIFQDRKTLVFVEVKTRYSQQFGSPAAAVTKWKLKSIIKTAQWFMILNPKLPKRYRIDVVAIKVDNLGNLNNLKHIKNVTG